MPEISRKNWEVRLEAVRSDFAASALDRLASLEDLEPFRVKYLGRKSELTEL
ncbi:MAG: phenylalanine--tRNA ligase subunit alpha, partial [Elusimicrobia bacterium]|nr:phenylalanine--tRNA ligase subunit alpha [Elusimicrobiota bacterium]